MSVDVTVMVFYMVFESNFSENYSLKNGAACVVAQKRKYDLVTAALQDDLH